MDEPRRQRRLLLFGLLAIELLLFTGPFLLGWLTVAWHDWQGLPPPRRLPFVAPMMAAGLLLALAWVGYDVLRFLRRRRRRRR